MADLKLYFESLLSSHVDGSHVVPPPAASDVVGEEISRRTRVPIRNLAEREVSTIERIITASPGAFVKEALDAVDEVALALTTNQATAFEAKIANPLHDPKWDFGRVKLLVRFTVTRVTIRKFSVRAFKSIESADLHLGRVNVFIGANGSGKSNLLEAFAALSAAAFGRVDNESINRRGARVGGYFRPMFTSSRPDVETVLEAEADGSCYQVTLVAPESTRAIPWEFAREIWKQNSTTLVDQTRSTQTTGDPQAGLAALKLAETPPDSDAAQLLKTLAAYSIYSPDTQILRVFCTPSTAIETWVLAALYPADPAVTNGDLECLASPANLLQAKPAAERLVTSGKKIREKYEAKMADITAAWPAVRQICTEAERFSIEVVAAIA